jgi:hypothetical protein
MDMSIINTKIVEDSKLSVNDMAYYLRQHSWQELPGQNEHLVVFQGINDDFGRPLLLVLPRKEGTSDELRHLAIALEMIAFLKNCSLESALTQIQDFASNYEIALEPVA